MPNRYQLVNFSTGVLLAGVIGTIASVNAWGQVSQLPADWATVVAAARKEGELHFYSAQTPAVIDRIVEGFKGTYPGIKVEAVRGSSGPLLARLDQERASSLDGADVFVSTEITWYTERAREARLSVPNGPNAGNWPPNFLIEKSVVIAGLEPFIIPYNKARIPVPPRGYSDLLRPEYQGKIGVSELAATATVAWYDWLEKTQGADYLGRIKAQGIRFYASPSVMSQPIAAGEILVGLAGFASGVKPLTDAGAPIDYVLPSPALGLAYGAAALAWSKRPNASAVFLDYIMSPQGQAVWHGQGVSASPLKGIKGALPAGSIAIYKPSDYPPDVVRAYQERWTRMMK